MVILEKGTVMKEFIGSSSAMMFNHLDGEAMIYAHVSPELLAKLKLGGSYDFACGRINDSIFICAKWGENPWSSMPFHPRLGKGEFTEFYEEGKGMPLLVLLINNENGEIVDMDMMALSNEFSNVLTKMSQDLMKKEFDNEKHRATIAAVYQNFSTDDELAKILPVKCHID